MRVSESPGDKLGYTAPLVRSLMSLGKSVTLSGLFALLLLAFSPAAAHADEVVVDFDHDGIRDIVTIPQAPARGLLVWLSGSNKFFRLATRRPIMRVVARDIDGDGQVDLVAADASARMHVWHRTTHGKLRAARPHRAPPSAGPRHSRTFDQSSDTDVPAIGDEAPTDLDGDTIHPAEPILVIERVISAVTPLRAVSPEVHRHDSRGPPAPF